MKQASLETKKKKIKFWTLCRQVWREREKWDGVWDITGIAGAWWDGEWMKSSAPKPGCFMNLQCPSDSPSPAPRKWSERLVARAWLCVAESLLPISSTICNCNELLSRYYRVDYHSLYNSATARLARSHEFRTKSWQTFTRQHMGTLSCFELAPNGRSIIYTAAPAQGYFIWRPQCPNAMNVLPTVECSGIKLLNGALFYDKSPRAEQIA